MDLAREKSSVPVVRQKGVFKLLKMNEILGAGKTDGRAVIAVAPSDVVLVADRRHARIIGVLVFEHLGIVAFEIDRLRLKRPFETVRAAAHVQMRHAVHALGAKHADETALPGNDRAVVNAGHPRERATADDRVGVITPDDVRVASRLRLPGNIRHCGANDSELHGDVLEF